MTIVGAIQDGIRGGLVDSCDEGRLGLRYHHGHDMLTWKGMWLFCNSGPGV